MLNLQGAAMNTVFFDCPHCKNNVTIGSNKIDKNFHCPRCGNWVELEEDAKEVKKELAPKKQPFNLVEWFKNLRKKQQEKKQQELANKPVELHPVKQKNTDPRYTSLIAKTTKNEDDIKYIYSKGLLDNVMLDCFLNPIFPQDLIYKILKDPRSPAWLPSRAIRHRNCPPEMVVETMEKNLGKDNDITRAAIFSDYCPASVVGRYLDMYLKDGMVNQTILNAAISPNVPTPIARSILKLNRNDFISSMLSQNQSVPKDASMEWKIAVGKEKDPYKIKKFKEQQANDEYNAYRETQSEMKKKQEEEQKAQDEALLKRMQEQDEALIRRMKEQDEARNNRPGLGN